MIKVIIFYVFVISLFGCRNAQEIQNRERVRGGEDAAAECKDDREACDELKRIQKLKDECNEDPKQAWKNGECVKIESESNEEGPESQSVPAECNEDNYEGVHQCMVDVVNETEKLSMIGAEDNILDMKTFLNEIKAKPLGTRECISMAQRVSAIFSRFSIIYLNQARSTQPVPDKFLELKNRSEQLGNRLKEKSGCDLSF